MKSRNALLLIVLVLSSSFTSKYTFLLNTNICKVKLDDLKDYQTRTLILQDKIHDLIFNTGMGEELHLTKLEVLNIRNTYKKMLNDKIWTFNTVIKLMSEKEISSLKDKSKYLILDVNINSVGTSIRMTGKELGNYGRYVIVPLEKWDKYKDPGYSYEWNEFIRYSRYMGLGIPIFQSCGKNSLELGIRIFNNYLNSSIKEGGRVKQYHLHQPKIKGQVDRKKSIYVNKNFLRERVKRWVSSKSNKLSTLTVGSFQSVNNVKDSNSYIIAVIPLFHSYVSYIDVKRSETWTERISFPPMNARQFRMPVLVNSLTGEVVFKDKASINRYSPSHWIGKDFFQSIAKNFEK